MRGLPGALLCVLLAAACSSTPPPAPPPPPVPDQPDALLKAAREAYSTGDFARGLGHVKRILEISPDKQSAYDRVGSVYFALGRGSEALGMWETALALERDPARKAALAGSINLARRSLGLAELPPAAEPAKPVRKPPRRRPAPKKPAPPVMTDREAAQAAYEKGVERYAAGEYLAATTLFMEALDIDPTHDGARKALERLKLRSP